MKHGSLFSGIGGFDLAAEWMGWENMFHCEWNEFGQKILKYYWPNAISYGDIDETDFTIHRGKIDVLSGGFPCQPYSNAGKRKGKEDERHKWPEFLRAIKEVQPGWVVGENVFGIINWSRGMVFNEVQTDLETAGYEVWSYVLPACAKNAPHRRDRVWFLAHRYSNGQFCCDSKYEIHAGKRREHALNDTKQNVITYPKKTECRNSMYSWTGWNRVTGMGNVGNVTNTGNQGLQRGKNNGIIGISRKKRDKQFTGLFQSNWEKFPTQSPLCSRNDGLSGKLAGITFSKHRTESIKGYGNAIVPQVAYEIFKAIEQYETTKQIL